MTAALAAQVAAHTDHVLFGLRVVMIIGIVLAVIATVFVVKSNKRLDERIQERSARKRAEAEAREAAIDGLSGRVQRDPARQSEGGADKL